MESNGFSKIKYTLALKLCSIFLVIIMLVAVVINIYPVALSRDLVSSSKQSAMLAQASVLSSSLSSLGELSSDDVQEAMQLLDVTSSTRVIVTDITAQVLYDSWESYSFEGRYALYSEINLALKSQTVFYSKYADGAFTSRTAMPISSGGTIIGAVFLYEYDSSQSELIAGISSTMLQISIAIAIVSLGLLIIFSQALTRKLAMLVRAVSTVRAGEYGQHINIVGNDEVSALTYEFNLMTDQLRETEELRRRFVSDASHELKTPLASIRLLSDSIVQTGNMDIETMREFVTDIGNESERLQRTTEKLLSLTRLDNAQVSQMSKISMKNVAENTLRLLKPLAQSLKIELNYDLADEGYIYANADDIYQIIFNLVENAIKYNTLSGYVNLKIYRETKIICMIVEDSGIGIPEVDLPHIFDRFYRVDKARSRDAGGSGLGLSIVRTATITNGGHIEVASCVPQGTRFVLTFPAYDGKEGKV